MIDKKIGSNNNPLQISGALTSWLAAVFVKLFFCFPRRNFGSMIIFHPVAATYNVCQPYLASK